MRTRVKGYSRQLLEADRIRRLSGDSPLVGHAMWNSLIHRELFIVVCACTYYMDSVRVCVCVYVWYLFSGYVVVLLWGMYVQVLRVLNFFTP